MQWLHELARRLRVLRHRDRLDRDLEEEMRTHLEMSAEENRESGMPAGEAQYAAQRQFGNPTLLKETSREMWGWRVIEEFMQDARLALRMLRKSSGFTAVAILTMALAIGPNTAIFSVLYAVLLAPLPYPDPDRLVVIWTQMKGARVPSSGDAYLAYQQQSACFETLAANYNARFYLSTEDEPVEVLGSTITPSFPAMLKAWPLAKGREFLTDEAQASNDRVVILNHRMWVERFDSDPNIVGKQIRFDGQPYTVVGVREAGPPDQMEQEFQVPFTFRRAPNGAVMSPMVIFGRLKPGIPISRAQAELSTIARRLAETQPRSLPREWTISVEPLKADFVGAALRRNLWLLMGTVVFVLLIACANVATLLLARGASRQKEVAVRASLGASTGRLFRQFLAESLSLALMGGAIGVWLGWAVLESVRGLMPKFSIGAESDPRMNLPVLLFTLGTSVLAGVLFGCVPAWRAARLDLGEVLKEGSRSVLGGSRGRLQRFLVAGEFALALTLLTAAGLAVHSFWNLVKVDLGIRTDHVFTASLQVPRSQVAQPDQIAPFYRQILDKLNATPGVLTAALSTRLPLQGAGSSPFSIAGQPALNPGNRLMADMAIVSPEYFQALSIRVVRGRQFTNSDTADAEPVAMVSDDFAQRWLPDVDPLSQYLLIARPRTTARTSGEPVQRRIVGVFHKVRYAGLQTVQETPPEIFVPFWQNPLPSMAIVARTRSDPAAMAKTISRAVRSVEPAVRLSQTRALDDVLEDQIALPRFAAALFGAFAGIALMLAAVGIYGVMAFAVSQRTHEIGLRIALGAEGPQVLRLILKDAMMLAGIGLLVGAGGAYMAHRLMRAAVVGVGGIDGLSLAAVSAILMASALAASYFPARRATKVDPAIALREE